MSQSSSRIHGLDTLRAAAIALVFCNHYMSFVTHDATFGWASEVGWAGVDLFFALSGYLIGNQIFAGLRDGGFSLARFYARRLLRTLPNYYVVLALYAFWPLWAGSSHPAPWWKYWTFTLNFDLIPGTLFSHAWSLCVEEQFYMVLPAVALCVALLRRSERHALAVGWFLLAASLAAAMAWRAHVWTPDMDVGPRGTGIFYTLIYYSTLCRFDELLFGVALAMLKNFHPSAWRRATARGNWTLAAGAVLTVTACALFIRDHYGFAMTVFGYPLLGLAFSLLLLAGLSPGGLLARTRIPGAGSIALWSYAIYLTHKQLCIILANKLAWNFDIGPEEPIGIALLIAASLAVGFLLYLVVETPFMKLRPARSALAAHLDHAERRLHVGQEGEEGAHAGRQLKVAGGRNRGAQAG
jgi:peptidoglycan/LPS O-acetylase OafA/YrhL